LPYAESPTLEKPLYPSFGDYTRWPSGIWNDGRADKFVEHWDLFQEVPQNSINPHPMF